MNDSALLNDKAPAVPVNQDVIQLLTVLLADAKAGRVASVAATVVSPLQQVQVNWAGPHMMQMYFGAGIIQKVLIERAAKPASGLVR